MSRYRKVDPRIWNDAKFRSLDDQGKLAFFFLLTHPHMTAIGAMRASIPGLAAEIGWPVEAFREAFRKASSKGMVEYDETASLVWLPNFLRYNPPESPNVVKAWASALDLLPECGLLSRVIAGAKAYTEGLNEGFRKALPQAFAKAMPIQEQEQEQEQEQKKTVASLSERGKPNEGGESGADGARTVGIPAGEVCRRLMQAGVAKVNPSHAKLIALLGAGLTVDEIVAVGPEAVEKGKGFEWILATAEGRRRDAAAVAPLPARKSAAKHGGFDALDYGKGIEADGRF